MLPTLASSLSATVASPGGPLGWAKAKGALPWSRAVVYGLGASGVAVARLLRGQGVEIVALDDSAVSGLPSDLQNDEGFSLFTGTQVDLSSIDVVVVSPGVPADRAVLQQARQLTVPVVAEVEVAFRVLSALRPQAAEQLVGITGSNGKSTTTQLVVELLGDRALACGNIGIPMSECAARVVGPTPASEAPILAVELSSFQLEGIERMRLPAAALLNLSPDHLDRHGTAEDYAAAKCRIFANQRAGDVAVLNGDDPALATVELGHGVRRRTFSVRGPVVDGCSMIDGEVWLTQPGAAPRRLFGRDDLAIVGEHNLANAMAAVLLAEPMGLCLEEVQARLGAFAGLPHRTQLVGELNGVRWYDDSKGTNVGATAQCLEGFADASVHLIAGGRGKGSGFSGLRDVVERKVARLYLVGEAADQLARDLGDLVEVSGSGGIREAVRDAHSQARTGESVLLSPACASFDQFSSFVERGLFFQREVQMVLARAGRDPRAHGSSVERGTSDG